MKKMMLALWLVAMVVAAGCASTLKVDNTPVAALDLNRYLGEWYEIARFDHSFERGVEQGSATSWLRYRQVDLGRAEMNL